MTVKPFSLLRLILAVVVCLWASQGHAARWQEHRTAAQRALEDVDYAKAIEQLEAALYFARTLPAADRDIASLLENLTAIYLADVQYGRAWTSITHWETILAANAGQAWATEQQARRDRMTRILFEEIRVERGEAAGAAKPADDRARTGADPSAGPSALDLAPAAAPVGKVVPAAEAPAAPAAPVAPVAETAVPADGSGAYGIHLASYGSEADARSGWAALQGLYPDLLVGKRFALRPVDLGDRGIFIRLIALPFVDSQSAGAACADLERRAQYCTVVKAD
jgi:hypothetical protein